MSECLHTKTELKFFENFTHYNICKDCGKYLTDDERGLFKRIANLEQRLAAANTPSPQLDKEKMGQAIFDFFADVDNGDGTFAFDNYDARDIDILVDAIVEAIS